MPEVAYNQSLTNSNYYGFGTISLINKPNLDSMPSMINAGTRGGNYCSKENIKYGLREKVNRSAQNHLTDYMNESVDDLNFEEKVQINNDKGLEYSEMAETQNLDFDGDGVLDMDLYNLNIISNEKSEEVNDGYSAAPEEAVTEEPEQKLEEKSVNIAEKEEVIEESHSEIINPKTKSAELASEQEKPKSYEIPKNELKSVTANISNKQISMADGVVMGAGGLALAMMIMGRSGMG